MNHTTPRARGATAPDGHRPAAAPTARSGTRPALLRALHAEALKLAALPGARLGAALTIAIPVLLELNNTRGMAAELAADPHSHLHRILPDMGLMGPFFGAVGVVVLATACMAGEYTANTQDLGSARQLTTTLLVEPRRTVTLTAKVILLLATTAVLAAIACALTFTIATHALGEWAPTLWPPPWGRVVGVYAWWLLNAIGAMALACLSRGALVPLTWCITTTSLVSPSLLLSKVTDLAAWMPDAAAYSLVSKDYIGPALSTGRAWTALAVWALAALTLTTVLWTRKDA